MFFIMIQGRHLLETGTGTRSAYLGPVRFSFLVPVTSTSISLRIIASESIRSQHIWWTYFVWNVHLAEHFSWEPELLLHFIRIGVVRIEGSQKLLILREPWIDEAQPFQIFLAVCV